MMKYIAFVSGKNHVLSDGWALNMKASDLTVQGVNSPYNSGPEKVYCYKLTGEGKEAYVPPRFNMRNRDYDIVDFPEPVMKLRPDQARVMDGINELVDGQDGPCKHAFCHIYTGFGKTVIGTDFALSKKLPTLIIVNTDAIRQGWINTFLDQGLTMGKELHVASGSTLGKHDVLIMSIQLAVRNNFTREEYAHYGTVIVDEADVMCTQLSVYEMVKMYPRYMIGMSATVIRQDGLHKVLDIFWGSRAKWIIRLKTFDEKISMKMVILNTGLYVESRRNMRNALDWTAMGGDIAIMDERNEMIKNLCLIHRDKKILILCNRTEHVTLLESMLREAGEDVTSYYGKDKSYNDANVLVATNKKASRGFDDKQVSQSYDGVRFNMIILTMTMNQADQAIGRGLRGNSLLLYVMTDDNPTMKKHAQKMKDSYLKKGATVTEEHM